LSARRKEKQRRRRDGMGITENRREGVYKENIK
jgi:hypothetical protein